MGKLDPSCVKITLLNSSGDVSSDARETISNTDGVVDVRELDAASIQVTLVDSSGNVGSNTRKAIGDTDCVVDMAKLDSASLKFRVIVTSDTNSNIISVKPGE